MQIKIGNTLFLGGNSKFQLSSPIQGLESPAIRVGDGLYAGRDGGYVSGHFYGHRTLVLKGFYVGVDCDEGDELRRLLFGYLRIRYLTPIYIENNSGEVYYTEGYISDVKADKNGTRAGDFQITILCPDPILYGTGTTMDESEAWVETNLVFGSPTTVVNGGNVQALPIITLQGEIENPSITNNTTTRTLGLSLTTSSSDVLVINMAKRLVLLNGSSVNADRTIDSSWWSLLSENNEILLNGDSSSLSSATIKYRKGFVGI